MGQIEDRRAYTGAKLSELRGKLAKAADLCAGKACVYATGSYGRLEASEHSDLDAFIVGATTEDKEGRRLRLLPRLDEICVKADLITATNNLGLPPFDGDGEYLEFYSVDDLVKRLGTPEDDSLNTFTARLLLVLESTCLVEDAVYAEAIDTVLAPYWRDFQDHAKAFAPAFLANDILRLWRTLCVNYEARTSPESPGKRAKRRYKNYTLKHSRLLTCYSAILELLAIHSARNTVTPEDAKEMATTSPTERIFRIMEEFPKHHEACKPIIDAYEQFLAVTDRRKADLLNAFASSSSPDLVGGRDAMEALGNAVSAAVAKIGDNSRFYRLLIV